MVESMPASEALLRRSGAMASFLLGRGKLKNHYKGRCILHIHKLNSVIAPGALQRLIQLRLNKIPNGLELILALPEGVSTSRSTVHADMLDLTCSPKIYYYKNRTSGSPKRQKYGSSHLLERNCVRILLGGAHAKQESTILVALLQTLHGLLTGNGTVVVAG